MEFDKFYDKAYTWILYVGPRLIIAILFFILAQWVIKVIKRWLNKSLLKKDVDHNSIRPFIVSLSGTVLQVLVILAILQILSLQLTIFTAIVGGISVAAGLALSGTLQNFTSGILILLFKPYRVGDIILAQNHEGEVKSIQIFYTIINTYDNKTVIVPNSKLSNEVIVNFSIEGMRRLDIIWKVGFGFDFEKIKVLVHQSVKNFPAILTDPEPVIVIAQILPDGYQIELNVWAKAEDYNNLKTNFNNHLLNDLKRSDVKLPGM